VAFLRRVDDCADLDGTLVNAGGGGNSGKGLWMRLRNRGSTSEAGPRSSRSSPGRTRGETGANQNRGRLGGRPLHSRQNGRLFHVQAEAGTIMSSAGTRVFTETWGQVKPLKFSSTV